MCVTGGSVNWGGAAPLPTLEAAGHCPTLGPKVGSAGPPYGMVRGLKIAGLLIGRASAEI